MSRRRILLKPFYLNIKARRDVAFKEKAYRLLMELQRFPPREIALLELGRMYLFSTQGVAFSASSRLSTRIGSIIWGHLARHHRRSDMEFLSIPHGLTFVWARI